MTTKARAVTLLRRRGRRYYADLRGFRESGGRYEALALPGQRYGTTDRDVAIKLLADRIAELERLRRDRYLLGRAKCATSAEYAPHHLREKARTGKVRDVTVAGNQRELDLFMKVVGADRPLESITIKDIQEYDAYLSTLVSDILFEWHTMTFRPHPHRRLKNPFVP